MAVTTVTKDNFEAVVLQAEKPVLIDFYATWCGPCRMVSPLVDEIAEEYQNKRAGAGRSVSGKVARGSRAGQPFSNR